MTKSNDEKKGYPLTSYQKDIWIQQQLYPEKVFYNIGGYFKINGEIDCTAFCKAFNLVIQENDALRIVIVENEGEQLQRFLPELSYDMKCHDFSAEDDPAGYSTQWMQKNFIKPFALNGNYLFKSELLKAGERLYYWYIKLHHIIADGWGFSLITQRMADAYNSLVSGAIKENSSEYSYKDFIEENRLYCMSDAHKKSSEFWKERLKGSYEPLIKENDSNSDSAAITSSRKTITLRRDFYDSLKRFSQSLECSIFHLFLGTLALYFSKVYTRDEVTIGVPILNRKNAKARATVGLFINMLPLRIRLDKNLSFTSLMKAIRDELKECYRHQRFPFGEMKALDSSTRGRVEIILSYQNQDYDSQFVGAASETVSLTHQSEINALTVFVREFTQDSDVSIDFDYRLKVFDEYLSIDSMALHFQNILEQVLQSGEKNIAELDILIPEEREKILFNFNNTDTVYTDNKTIHQLFEEQVEKTPDSIAVVYGDSHLTYRQLNEMSNRIAAVLRNTGAKSGSIVGIMMERSIEMVSAILGILKSGAAFVPLSTEYPEDRNRHIIEDSGVQGVLVSSGIGDAYASLVRIINVTDITTTAQQTSNIENINTPDDTVYLIYTSGTTGRPKGVMLKHKNLVNLIAFEYMKTNIDFTGRVLQFTNICFDVCYQEIFSVLLCGGSLYIINEEQKRDVLELFRFIEMNCVETIFLPTAYLRLIAGEERYTDDIPRNVKHIITAGEQLILTDNFRRYLLNSDVYLHNHYGPSETHVVTTYSMHGQNTSIVPPIGKPISNTKIYIMDRFMKLQAVGAPGELYIAGECIGGGYINNDKLTSDKFLPNPFGPGKKMYRSGDLARWLPDGNIEFISRIDHQVKIRGHRVELAEVEIMLLDYDKVKEAIVTVREDETGNRYLCAYVVAQSQHVLEKSLEHLPDILPDYMIPSYFSSSEPLTAAELKNFLTTKLPGYMIPSYFVLLDSIPLTGNGKVDKKALPEPTPELNMQDEYVAPRNHVENCLAEVWEKVLGIQQIGINDNFFELGGDSIKAGHAVSKLYGYGFKISIKDFIMYQTISNLSSHIEADDTITSQKTDGDSRAPQGSTFSAESPGKKVLNITLQKNITTYLAYSLPLCVIIANEKVLPWYYQHFIQICAQTGLSGGYTMLDYVEPILSDWDIVEMTKFPYTLFSDGVTALDLVIEKINLGHYIFAYLDEFFIEVKESYQKNHFVHETLVFGYDNNCRKLMAVGFGKGHIFTIFEISYDYFIKAFESGIVHYKETAEYAEEQAIGLFRLKELDEEYPFERNEFLDSLEDYIESKNRKGIISYMIPPGEAKELYGKLPVVYGIDVYDVVIEKLQQLLQRKPLIDYRSIHLMAEHKEELYKRLKYFTSLYKLDDARTIELLRQYKKIPDKLQTIRAKFFGYSMSKIDIHQAMLSSVKKWIDVLAACKRQERSILVELYEQLRK